MNEIETVLHALVVKAYEAGWLDGDDGASKLLRYTLQEYTTPTEEKIAAEQRAEREREVDQRIRDWKQRA